MPKLGAKPDDRPYTTRCLRCGCLVEKLVSRFNLYGKGVKHEYRCANPYHNCGTVERDGCEPHRVYGELPRHALWDGAGGVWEHPGTLEDCTMPECADRKDRHRAGLGQDTDWHPGPYVTCDRPECEPPFEGARAPWAYSDEHVESWTIDRDDHPDPLAPCPLTGRKHRWRWADDGCGHSGDVCECGAYEE